MRESSILRGEIDEFLERTIPDQGPRGVKGLLDQSRDFTRRGRSAEAFEGLIEEAKRNAGKSGTGGNLDNSLRQAVDRTLKKQGKFLNQAEREAAERIVRGTRGQNAARLIGRGLSPTTGALNSLATTGAALATSGASIPVQLAGLGLKKGSEATTKRRINDLVRQIQAGSKDAAARPETTLSQAVTNSKKQQELAAILALLNAG